MKLHASRNTIIALWMLCVGVSAWINYKTWSEHKLQMANASAEAFIGQVILTRLWNASHERVYVPVSGKTLPNSYLEVPERDIVGSDGSNLTMINPAFMTRQIAELSEARSENKFHLTSLRPLRPGNEPTPVEKWALEKFELDPRPVSRILETPEGRRLFYMAPMITEEPCLKCHGRHGYQEGDIRGGISLTMPLQLSSVPVVLLGSHATLLGVGLAGIWMFFYRLGIRFHVAEYDARHDGLTGLLNRRAFSMIMERELLRARRHDSPVCLMLIDADDFKVINDHYGHPAGDQALRELAYVVRTHVRRASDAVGRYGGEEFIVLLPDTPAEVASELAEKIRLAVMNHKVPGPEGKPFGLSVSIGVARQSDYANTAEELLSRADEALYAAKRQGKNQVCWA